MIPSQAVASMGMPGYCLLEQGMLAAGDTTLLLTQMSRQEAVSSSSPCWHWGWVAIAPQLGVDADPGLGTQEVVWVGTRGTARAGLRTGLLTSMGVLLCFVPL